MSERLLHKGQERQSRSRRKSAEPQNVPAQEIEITPEQRTEAFFKQDVMTLANAMRDRLIVSIEDQKMIRVDTTQGWTKEENDSTKYLKTKAVELHLGEMAPGTLGIFPYNFRKMRQSLVSAESNGQQGGCVRLERASRYDPDTKQFIPLQKEGDIANYFEFNNNEAVQLRFIDNTGILYFNREAPDNPPQTPPTRQ